MASNESSELPLWIPVGSPNGPDWPAITARNARSVQTVVGWIFWDPGAVARYEALGLPDYLAAGLGYQAAGYLAARAAPLAPVGPEAVIAAFGSISPLALRVLFPAVAQSGRSFLDFWRARDEALWKGFAATPRISWRPWKRWVPGFAPWWKPCPGWGGRSLRPTWICLVRMTPCCRVGMRSTACGSGEVTLTGRSSRLLV
ncbi:hypothetical protein A4G26_15735 [Mycobacterium kansasii]|uniref:Uncharacterized protein n=1 Tax=Mycobacterium innocens TaxID=2341083 RepID=A0A498Q8V8_9MYCO|nr:hypothetical protein A4G26_15735 [Mycobacterium kansasii]VBA41002.1 hypothetical protein LAUMK13_03333 [Mycobacterium innocens]